MKPAIPAADPAAHTATAVTIERFDKLAEAVGQLSRVVAALLDAVDAHQIPLPSKAHDWRKARQ